MGSSFPTRSAPCGPRGKSLWHVFWTLNCPLLLDIFPGLSSPEPSHHSNCHSDPSKDTPPANPQFQEEVSPLDPPEEPVKYRKDVLGSKPDEFTAQPCPLPSCGFRQLISSFWPSGSSPGKLIQDLAQCFSNPVEHKNHLGAWLKCRFWIQQIWEGPGILRFFFFQYLLCQVFLVASAVFTASCGICHCSTACEVLVTRLGLN